MSLPSPSFPFPGNHRHHAKNKAKRSVIFNALFESVMEPQKCQNCCLIIISKKFIIDSKMTLLFVLPASCFGVIAIRCLLCFHFCNVTIKMFYVVNSSKGCTFNKCHQMFGPKVSRHGSRQSLP